MIVLEGLTAEHRVEPCGVDVPPRFGWRVAADENGVVQHAWRIRVTDDAGREVSDSGWVESAECVDVPYDGPPLHPLTRYGWRVDVRTSHGGAEASSSFVTGVLDGDWHGAAWIGHPHPSGAAPVLRTTVDVGSVAAAAYLVVAAGGYAHATLDGRPVDDAVLSPGFTDYDARVQYVVTDVTALLTPGRHILELELGRGFYAMAAANTWDWHRAPWRGEPCARVLLVVTDARGGVTRLVSDERWRAADGPTREDDLYAGETYDARRPAELAGAAAWVPATVVPGPRGRPEWQRQQPITAAGRLEPVDVAEVGDGAWVYDFGRVIAGWAEVRAADAAGEVVELRYAERLGPDGRADVADHHGYYAGRFQTDRLVLAGAERPVRWQPRFGYKGFRYVEVCARRRPELTAVVVHTAASRTGTFRCSSDLLNRVHELTVRTVLNNLHGLPTDTPKYEKNGWTGDGMLGAELMLMNLDTHALLDKWVDDIADSRHGSPAPAVIAPHGGWRMDWTPAPPWHSAYVLIPWWIWWYTGDRRPLERHWDGMTAYVGHELARSPGGIAATTLGDWVSPETDPAGGNAPEDSRVPATAFLALMLDTLARAAEVVGDDGRRWADAAGAVRAAFRAEFHDAGAAMVRGAGDHGYRQSHNVLALAFGLLEPGEEQRVADRLARDVRERGNRLGTGALSTKYLLPTLTRYGHADLALVVARQTEFPSWGHWLAHGATSLWEHWSPDARSHGHYFLGTIDDWLYHDVLGLRPVRPGWRRARLAPAVPGLDWARGAVTTPYGRLAVRWHRTEAGVAAEVEVPVGVVLDVAGRGGPLGPGRHEVVLPAEARPGASLHDRGSEPTQGG
ncbi:alpha-L-rhamnosidase [Jiangella rhizosphaerae]|uniref:alpha-L-rhamnosidase n=1 Tax=Jiangella rhizosphaerae TaxID=2293569 RepID=UPI00131471C4|nr:alpha-L-rhamnosidase [Jiangella rhizosphaerae]